MLRMGWLLALLLFSSAGFAAREINVGFAADNAPLSAQDGTGLEVMIVKTALEKAGFVLKAQYFDINKLRTAISKQRVDAVAGIVKPTVDYPFISSAYLQLNNSLIIDQNSGCTAKGILSLQDCEVVTSSASAALLPDLAKLLTRAKQILKKLNMPKPMGGLLVPNNSSVWELESQAAQHEMFWRQRANAYIGDSHVFAWYQHNRHSEQAANAKIKTIKLGADYGLRVGFVDADVSNDFNRALKQLAKDGTLVRLAAVYQIPVAKMEVSQAPVTFIKHVR